MKTRKELKKLYNTLEFQKEYQYDGKDLGALCTQAGTTFTCGALWQKKWSCDCIEMESIVSAFKKLLCRKKRGESGATRQRDICMAFIMIINPVGRRNS